MSTRLTEIHNSVSIDDGAKHARHLHSLKTDEMPQRGEQSELVQFTPAAKEQAWGLLKNAIDS